MQNVFVYIAEVYNLVATRAGTLVQPSLPKAHQPSWNTFAAASFHDERFCLLVIYLWGEYSPQGCCCFLSHMADFSVPLPEWKWFMSGWLWNFSCEWHFLRHHWSELLEKCCSMTNSFSIGRHFKHVLLTLFWLVPAWDYHKLWQDAQYSVRLSWICIKMSQLIPSKFCSY